MLLPRAKFSQGLTLLLSALLACPSNLPSMERDAARPDFESFRSLPSCAGPVLHKPDRKSCPSQEDWSVLADEPEVPLGRDDFRYAPLALPHRPLDLPSLVPAALDPRPLNPIAMFVSTTHVPPLRC